LGFSSIGGFIILFFALIIIASSFMIIQGRLVDSTTLTFDTQQQKLATEMQTKIDIINISFDNTTAPDTTTLNIKNTGHNKINIEFIDIFIDNIKIPRYDSNRTINFAPDSLTINPLHWDQDETIIIEVYLDLQNVTHIATASTEYGIIDSATFLG